MTVKDYIYPGVQTSPQRPSVSPEAHVLDALAAWRRSPDGCVDVVAPGEAPCGSLSSESLLAALADIFAPQPECSLVEVRCDASDYSASAIARAVEDADAQLLGLWRLNGRDEGDVSALLMVGAPDAGSAIRSLRRFGYLVTPLSGYSDSDLHTALQNIEALKMFLEI